MQNTNYVKDNIILINLLREFYKDNEVSKVFGISELLRATIFFVKKTNPFKDEDFNELKLFIENFKKFNSITDEGGQLTEEQEKELKLLKEKCKNLMVHISKENSLLYKLNDSSKIIERAKKDADKKIYAFSALGFLAGFIPIPYLGLPITFTLNFSMILKIGNCFNIKFEDIPYQDLVKLIFGIETTVESAVKVGGGMAASAAGNNFGKTLVKEIGSEQVKDWKRYGIDYLSITEAKKVGESLVLNNESKFNNFINYIYSLFPSFEKGIKDGINNKGNKLGKIVNDIVWDQSGEVLEGQFGRGLINNANSYLPKFLPRLIPVIGSIIGGISDSYSIYKVGKNSIKYFEDYVKKTMGCEFVLRRKKEYEEILNSLDIMSKNNFEKYKINILD